MKTPMQELIEQLEKTIYGSDEYGRGATDATIDTINLAKELLEKEIDLIEDAFYTDAEAMSFKFWKEVHEL